MTAETVTTPTRPRLPAELLDSSLFLLKRLGFASKERTVEAYAGMGLSPYHHAVLTVLDEGSRETQGSIADALGFDRGQLVGFLDDLEERGLVERRRDPADRRRHTVRMTDEGRDELAKLRALSRRLEDEFLASLSSEQRLQLQALLRQLAEEHLPNCALTAFASLPSPPQA